VRKPDDLCQYPPLLVAGIGTATQEETDMKSRIRRIRKIRRLTRNHSWA
jgi:hypothetical protein